MKTYLETAGGVPAVVDTEEEPGDAQGLVTSSIQHGEIFLRSKAGAVYRLVWDSAQKPRAARALPAGSYVLQGYRMTRDAWFISSTGGRQTVRVEAGVTTALDVDPKIGVKLRAFRVRGKVSVQLGVTGHDRKGVSVYRNGKRVDLNYTLATDKGTELASGTLEYG